MPLWRYEHGKLCDAAAVDYALQVLVVWNQAARRRIHEHMEQTGTTVVEWERAMHAAARATVGETVWNPENMWLQQGWLDARPSPDHLPCTPSKFLALPAMPSEPEWMAEELTEERSQQCMQELGTTLTMQAQGHY
mmetsp:Transcript_20500/g.51968  ORF Transcript_20500/g.51968 Transcript_20500/m.51968 type:complete len:136 (-) Transcript_20500:321-728(-)